MQGLVVVCLIVEKILMSTVSFIAFTVSDDG